MRGVEMHVPGIADAVACLRDTNWTTLLGCYVVGAVRMYVSVRRTQYIVVVLSPPSITVFELRVPMLE